MKEKANGFMTLKGDGRQDLVVGVVDWNGDGRLDLVCNSKSVMLYENVGERDGKWLYRDRGDLADEVLAGHTTSPSPCNFDRNGVSDLLVGADSSTFSARRCAVQSESRGSFVALAYRTKPTNRHFDLQLVLLGLFDRRSRRNGEVVRNDGTSGRASA